MSFFGSMPQTAGPFVGRIVDPPEHPILFSAPMISAILAGRKTQTRRLIRPQPFTEPGLTGPMVGHQDLGGMFAEHVFRPCAASLLKCRYGVPGDRLWVREAWAWVPAPPGDARHICHVGPDGRGATWAQCWRRDSGYKWKPSIHMPRWASRIQLEVTAIRVQRLQEITAEDAKAEGLAEITKDGRLMKFGIPDRDGLPGTDDDGQPWIDWEVDPIKAFRKLWDSINAARMSWATNPWVFAVSFKVVTP